METEATPAAKTPPQKVTIGRTVHYVLPKGQHAGQHRAAIINEVYTQLDDDKRPGMVTLSVFVARPALDFPGLNAAVALANLVIFDAAATPGTWHWPERES